MASTTSKESSAIIDEIWGPATGPDEARSRFDVLSAGFFSYYENEQRMDRATNGSIVSSIRLLKSFPRQRKSELRDRTDGSTPPEPLPLDLAVRWTFLTACCRPGTMNLSGENIFRPKWKDSESLEAYMDRVYPILQPPQQDLAAFRPGKLCASYLRLYANVQLRWTNHLSDHLILLKGEDWKSLYVFRHAGFLKVSLDKLAADDEDLAHKPSEALKLGCLPPNLLKETLMTLNMLFPVIGDAASRTILEREVEQNGLGPYFLDRFYLDSRDHERPGDALEPRDVRTLYEKYPYWADRLYDLWREADDPTPITRIERWTESRRNPRFTYWCTVLSIVFVVMFGLVATGLAGVQVWIAYCDWIDDPSRPQCGYKTTSNEHFDEVVLRHLQG